MNIMDIVNNKKKAIEAASGRRERTVRPQPGKSKFRILPGWRGDEDPTFFHDFGQHYIKDGNDDLKAVYMCTEKTYGKPCPICQALSDAKGKVVDDDNLIKAIDESRASNRMLFNALHLDGEDPSSPIILEVSPTTAQKIFDIMGGEDGYGDITDLESGTDIIISRSGKGLNTEYSIYAAPKSGKVNKAVMKNLHNLDDYVNQEFDEGRNKALAAVSTVAGALPLSTGGGGGAATAIAHDPTAVAEDADYPTAEVAEYSEPKPKAVEKAAPAIEEYSDSDLDDMLADLELD